MGEAEQLELTTAEEIQFFIETEFGKWIDELKGKTADEDEMLNGFCERSGIKRNNPLAMMYFAFIGGYNHGMEFESKLHERE